ncbi:topoisomerase TOP1-interacting protein BTBD1 [Aphelenchoides avenae]|nr:topoisomerase TOP1-interacting protein BTBD1 [Aphelenchus avenae]
MSVALKAESGEPPVQLGTILLKPELSDIRFSVSKDGEKPKIFHAHRLVLAVASDVFRTMFYGSVPQDDPVVIKDSSATEFEAFLRLVISRDRQ